MVACSLLPFKRKDESSIPSTDLRETFHSCAQCRLHLISIPDSIDIDVVLKELEKARTAVCLFLCISSLKKHETSKIHG